MPQATGQFGASNIVAEFQGFFSGGTTLTTRAAQNCVVNRTGVGQYQLLLNNVVPDDCNFMPQVVQFVPNGLASNYSVGVAFPPFPLPANTPAVDVQNFNYIQFQFYLPGGGSTPADPNAYGLFNITVFNCNDGLVGLTNPATGTPFRTPGNP